MIGGAVSIQFDSVFSHTLVEFDVANMYVAKIIFADEENPIVDGKPRPVGRNIQERVKGLSLAVETNLQHLVLFRKIGEYSFGAADRRRGAA